MFLWPPWYAARSARGRGVPYVMAPRGMLVPELIHRRNRLAKTLWLRLLEWRNLRHADALHCPWLVCVGEVDNVALPGPAIAAGRRAPKGEVRTYPGVAHFDIYDGPEHEAVVADEIEFLRRHLRPAT